MGRYTYTSSADGPLDVDRGSSAVSTKRAEWVPADEYEQRAAERLGALEQDQMVETMPAKSGMTRTGRDSLRAYPRATTAELGHPQKERLLPEPDSIRHDLSSRQKKARSQIKLETQRRMPQTQYDSVDQTISDPVQWRRLNNELSDVTGDAVLLSDRNQKTAHRIDRAIQAYERGNDRGHVVYANVRLPRSINSSNIDGFVQHQFPDEAVVAFDRYTGCSHTMHQTSGDAIDNERTAVFEIQTRRGMYLGRSDSLDDTAHLLPRGMRLRVAGAHNGRYTRPDGTEGRRVIIQLIDDTPTTAGGRSHDMDR